MTELEYQIGQMLMVGIGADELAPPERKALARHGFGGFILFGSNCRDLLQIHSLCNSLREAAGVDPPFIAIDQEGGRVQRLPPPFSRFPAPRLIGASENPELAARAGRATAAELALVGINLDFAPVLDVDSNPRNPIIGDRSFGVTPEQVTRIALPWMRGLRDGGIIPCGKHFPGHGGTDKDSHLTLPALDKPLADLRRTELPPFVQACSAGIEALMTAHVVFPALDGRLPATLSAAVVGGLLREQLGYRGVVFSDDLEMQAISGHFAIEEAALLAVGAGVDVLLCGHELANAIRVFEFLGRTARSYQAFQARIAASHRRIRTLKGRFLQQRPEIAPSELPDRLARFEHERLIEEIYGSL